MSRLWEDAVGILETATIQQEPAGSDFAILLDDRNGIRIVDAQGWRLDALQTEYSAGSAFLVKRTATSVQVEAQSGPNRCALRTSLNGGVLWTLTGELAHHLIFPQTLSLAAASNQRVLY